MTAEVLTGHYAAARMLQHSAERANAVMRKFGRPPRLVAVLGENDPAAAQYWGRIERLAASAGLLTELVQGEPERLIDDIVRLNADPDCDAILPLAPFPSGFDVAMIAAALCPQKDVDGLTPQNAGLLARGLNGLFPCTPQAAIVLAEGYLGNLRGLVTCVVGASPLVGRPLVELLLQRGATVTVAHVDTLDLPAATLPAQLMFVATGKAGLIDARHVGHGACIIDIGINVITEAGGGTRVVGDVDYDAVSNRAVAISAVPDGVGPLTTAFLVDNSVKAAEARFATR